MRTTIDLPEDLHRLAKEIAHDKSCTFSQAVSWLMRRGVGQTLETPRLGVNKLTGFPSFETGRIITSEDVKRLEDDE